MQLCISLPPSDQREIIIKAWVDAIIGDSSFDSYLKSIHQLIEQGNNHNGIACLLLDPGISKLIRNRVLLKRNSEWVSAALAHPISLN